MTNGTTRTALDADLVAVRDDILRLGSLVYRASQRALEAFSKNDTALAKQVITGDDELDELHHHVESMVASTVARQGPMATDLRRLLAALLIANELERMGDHAEGIAKTVVRYTGQGRPTVPPLLPQMLEHIKKMLYEAMEAYVAEDAEKAAQVARMDDRVDDMYNSLFQLVVGEMHRGDLSVELGTYILWAGHSLERIGDRVTNICERVKYASTGIIDDLNTKDDAA
ncbi:MAG: phosphate signaling complex protein PhoU [Chloroflexi bacterium]|nr:phosphate signaling complex protein PhoU [Chloroflexota bacterium]